MALSRLAREEITVIDIGARLSKDKRLVVDRLGSLPPNQWPPDDIEFISESGTRASRTSLPEKRSYGSDFPFKDMGQLEDVFSVGNANRSVISGAYGGFSNVWGAQVVPLSARMFADWPVSFEEMEPHYKAVLTHIPFAGEDDDLSQIFPLIAEAQPLPPLHQRTKMVLAAYGRNRARVRALGITVGRARLAFDAKRCVSCGLCLTGCPHSLIYSASQTFDDLIAKGRITYHDDLIAHRLSESADSARVTARRVSGHGEHVFEADRVFVACGGIGSTRLVLESLDYYDKQVFMDESVQFVVPALSVSRTADPRQTGSFTLNQFNMVVALDQLDHELAQVHFYSYNPEYLSALTSILKTRLGATASIELLRRLTVGLGYLPSWASPRLRITARPPRGSDRLAAIEIARDESASTRPPMLRSVLRRMLRAGPYLDLWPVTFMQFVAAGAKSYHFGGSLPHRARERSGTLTTDRVGRLSRWARVHVVDGSVFPNVPASTFTLTVMANAHRIAEEASGLSYG